MIWHAFLVGALLDADQITGSKLCHFKRACSRSSGNTPIPSGA
jgi:hypothetical protein